MEEISLQVLKNYGLIGFIILSVLLFSGWIVNKIITHFLAKDISKDSQMVAMNENMIDALGANTSAIQRLAESHHEISLTMQTLSASIEHHAQVDRQEHANLISLFRVSNITGRN